MDYTVTFATNTATLAVFDPERLGTRVDDDADWWCVGNFWKLNEVASGEIALVNLGSDGVYKVRLTDGQLTADERAYAADHVRLGAVVTSGWVFIGPGELLPGEGLATDPTNAEFARWFCRMPAGAYEVEAYGIDWQECPDWYMPEDTERAPPDVVLLVTPRRSAFTVPEGSPSLFERVNSLISLDGWLFPDELRRLGPVPGMVLSTMVISRRGELALKPCGPGEYRPVLQNMAGFKVKDQLDVKVLSVDHERKEFQCE
ncbi:MAG: DUF6386 family protein [Candidatus Obscuribacterales bacterium]|nr:DUF6386 family protein [Candidatus Obscuribacterales bacterium]